jgi:ATP/maltotriose-dependent transcriptional regulator MalT
MARDSREAQDLAITFAAAARVSLALGRLEEAKGLVVELARMTQIRSDPYYVALLPELVRTALALAEQELAARLLEGVSQATPMREHALIACHAELAAAAGEHARAAALFAEAAERWRDFENVPERAYALLGQGRCMLADGDAGGQAPLAEARALFASIGYGPALGASEALALPYA